MTLEFRIYPPIGISRVGNSETDFYYGPETYLGLPTELSDGEEIPITDFRDSGQKIKRQAARFYIYAFDSDKPVEEASRVIIGQDQVTDIEWTVHLANKKASWYTFKQLQGEGGYEPDHPLRNPTVTNPAARAALNIDAGPQSVSSINNKAVFTRGQGQPGYQQHFPPSKLQPFSIDTLGEIQIDPSGCLTALGGFGHSGSDIDPAIGYYANNNNWWDDVSDGPVTAKVVLANGDKVPVSSSSWLLVAPPAFAPQIPNMINLYDVMYDTAVKNFNYAPALFAQGRWLESYEPSFIDEIKPILERPALAQWVFSIPQDAHLFDLKKLGDPDPLNNPLRQALFSQLRTRDQVNLRGHDERQPLMPLLTGDNPMSKIKKSRYLALTDTQYFLLEQWSKGKFCAPDQERTIPHYEALSRAILQNCVGGAFCPGIEMTWIARNPLLFDAPFRVKHKSITGDALSPADDFDAGMEPGDLTKRMALPWQADFNECSVQTIDDEDVAWWPSQRPYQVFPEPKNSAGTRVAPWARGIAHHGETPGDLTMVTQWKNLGFVKKINIPFATRYLEVERNEDAFDPPTFT